MNDTPQYIKELQLKVWLSKTPGERLMQFMKDNASLFQFWTAVRNVNDVRDDNDVNLNKSLPITSKM